MPHVDTIVLALVAVALVASLVHQWRRGLRWRHFVVTVFAMFFSLVVIISMIMHDVDVLWGLTHGLRSMTGEPFAYDWRNYSLLLFGALMAWMGARFLGASLRMGRGDDAGRAEFLRLALVVLAIVVPIIPLNPFFGPAATIATVLALVVVGLGGRRLAATTGPAAEPGVRASANA